MSHSPEVMQMAAKIADHMDFTSMSKVDWQLARDAAALAIVQTTELAAKKIETIDGGDMIMPPGRVRRAESAQSLRTFTHLSPKREG